MVANNSQQATPYFAYSLNQDEPGYGQLLVDGFQNVLAGKADGAAVAKMIQDALNGWGYIGAIKCS